MRLRLRRPDWRQPIYLLPAFIVEGLVNFAVAVVLSILLIGAGKHLDWLAHHFGPGQLATMIFAVCVVLFFLRHFYRFAYALIEFLLGGVLVVDTILNGVPDPTKLDEPILKIAAGMYLVIRGIDNCVVWAAEVARKARARRTS